MLGEAPSPATPGSPAGPTTTSAVPIAPVFAGAMVPYSFSSVLRASRTQFLSEQFFKAPDSGTDFRNPHVPRPMGPKGGIEIQRHLSGVGIPFADPLDNFKPGRLEIDKKPTRVRRPSRPADPNRMRKRGAAAYRRVNRQNADYGQEL